MILAEPEALGFEDLHGEHTREVEVCIVGAGPGGAAAARALTARGRDVLILERGPKRSNFRPNMGHTMRYHMQEAGALVAMGSAPLPIAAGQGVGGGSLINSAICFRTPDEVLEGWCESLSTDRFSPAAMAPLFDELEALLEVGEVREGVAGANNQLIVRGAEARGWPGGLVRRNTPGCAGCGLCNFGCPVSGKNSVNRNLLPLAVQQGAVIQAEAQVEELILEGDRVRGLRARARDPETGELGGSLTIRAERVILSCGAIGTPRLLHACGLSAAGRAVGDGLHVHPGNAVLGVCDEDIYLWRGATQGAYFTAPHLPGVLPHGFTAPPEVLALASAPVFGGMKEAMAELHRLCGMVVMVSDKGAGRVRARKDGRADVRYDFAPEDVRRIKAGMVATAEVLLAGGARRVFGLVHGTGACERPEQLEAALEDRTIRDFSLYAAHPMSSCRMGRDLTEEGAFVGVKNLYAADASVFPSSLGVNPQMTTMAMAHLVGEAVADDLGSA